MSAEELVQLVDAFNRPIGSCTRKTMREFLLRHRATYILVVNSRQQFCVQRRSLNKDYCPGLLDIVAGGVVQADEDYTRSAVRELAEELGVSAPLHFLTEFYTEGEDGGRAFGYLFVCQWDGSVYPQAEEIDAIEWLSVAEINARAAEVTTDSLLALDIYVAWLNGSCHSPTLKPDERFCLHDKEWTLSESITLHNECVWLIKDARGQYETVREQTLLAVTRDKQAAGAIRPYFSPIH